MLTRKGPKRLPPNIFLILLLMSIFLFQVFPISCKFGNDTDEQSIDSADPDSEDNLYLFEYEKIRIEDTSSIDVKIKNCNLYLDIYKDMIIMGEIENISGTNKTNIEITLDFLDKHGNEIISAKVPAPVNYLRSGSRLPFYYYLTDKQKYIEIYTVKIGVNYKDYYERFEGNPIVEIEGYKYEEDYLIIEGRVINIGEEKIRNIKLFCTFYNDKDRVVFIKQCYLPREEMNPGGEQRFTLKLLFDEYLPDFTHYGFEVFFEDEIREPV
ncbi:MAG: FxLYD domain-containing protein [Actinomycetota bacterium]|nr:FxLYD domain-containing protein [Actinomycetota bacterium]